MVQRYNPFLPLSLGSPIDYLSRYVFQGSAFYQIPSTSLGSIDRGRVLWWVVACRMEAISKYLCTGSALICIKLIFCLNRFTNMVNHGTVRMIANRMIIPKSIKLSRSIANHLNCHFVLIGLRQFYWADRTKSDGWHGGWCRSSIASQLDLIYKWIEEEETDNCR